MGFFLSVLSCALGDFCWFRWGWLTGFFEMSNRADLRWGIFAGSVGDG